MNTGGGGPGFTTLDGVALVAPDRILLTNQTTKSQNGVWIYNGSAALLTRPVLDDQYRATTQLSNSTVVWVTAGTLRGGTVWGLDVGTIVTVNTTNHTLTRIALPPAQARVASEGINYALGSTFGTIDGVAVVGNGLPGSDIVLLKDQTNAAENGLYWVNTAGPLTGKRTTEPVVPSREVRVSEGTRNASTAFVLRAQGALTLDTTALPFLRQDVKNYSVDTVALLKTLRAEVLVGATASVAGYYAPGDQGGGQFTFLGVPTAMKIASATVKTATINLVTLVNGQINIQTAAPHTLGAPGAAISVYLSGAGAPNDGAYLATVVTTTTFIVVGVYSAAPAFTLARWVNLTTSTAHGRRPGERLTVAGVVPSGGALAINGLSSPGGVVDATNLTLAVPTSGGTYSAAGAAAVIGDDGLRIGAANDAGTAGGVWQRTVEPGDLNVKWFGAKGDGVTDDTAAIRSAVYAGAAIGTGISDQPAAVLHFPGAKYQCASQLPFDTVSNLVWTGPAQINYTDDGGPAHTNPFLSLLSVNQFRFENITFSYDHVDFAGTLVKAGRGISRFPPNPTGDSSNCSWNGCIFRGENGAFKAAQLLVLEYVEIVHVTSSTFSYASTGIQGVVTGFSNVVLIQGCTFYNLREACIKNAKEAWTIQTCTFEPLTDGLGNQLSKNAYVHDDLVAGYAWAFQFIGNRCGDGDFQGPWVSGKFLGAQISGNILLAGGDSDPDAAALIVRGSAGVAISGNRLSGPIKFALDADNLSNAGVALFGNTVQAQTPHLGTGTVGAFTRVGNEDALEAEDRINLPLRFGNSGTLYGSVVLGMSQWANPGTIEARGAAGDVLMSTLSIVGALIGDAVSVGIQPVLPPGIIATGMMTADGQCTVVLQNLTAGAEVLPALLLVRVHTVRQPPQIFSVDVPQGPSAGGTTVVIDGLGFQDDAVVTFDTIPAAAVTWISSSQLTVVTPAHPVSRTVNIVVRNPDGAGGLTSGGTGNALFGYWPFLNVVTPVTPVSGPAAGGTPCTVTGAGFLAGATVTFGGSAAIAVVIVSPTKLTCTTPAHAVGVVDVVVTNPGGATSVPSGAGAFTYT